MSLERLLDDFYLHQQSRSAAIAVKEKIYEMAEHGSYPTSESIGRIPLLLESADSHIAGAGASAVAVLGKRAWPIRLDIWKLYFRIIEKNNELCKFNSKGGLFDPFGDCDDVEQRRDNLQFSVCSALIGIGDMPSDRASIERCVAQ